MFTRSLCVVILAGLFMSSTGCAAIRGYFGGYKPVEAWTKVGVTPETEHEAQLAFFEAKFFCVQRTQVQHPIPDGLNWEEFDKCLKEKGFVPYGE